MKYCIYESWDNQKYDLMSQNKTINKYNFAVMCILIG